MEVTSATLLHRNPDVVLREEDSDGALLFNPDTNQIRVLNATGLFIWKLMDGTTDMGSAITALRQSFEDVSEDVESHTLAFATDMLGARFLHAAACPECKETPGS